jgi:streptogramin lyase
MQQTWDFSSPNGIAVDGDGFVYVLERGRNRVQKLTSSGQFVTAWGGFNEPRGIAVDNSGFVYVSDWLNDRVQKFTSAGQFVTEWGSSGGGEGQFRHLRGIAVDTAGYVYVAEGDSPGGSGYVPGQGNYRIQKFTADGQFVTTWGSLGSGDGQFQNPTGIAVDSDYQVYVSDRNRIQKFTADGQFVTTWGSTGGRAGEFSNPVAITIDSNGFVYVVDSGNHRIQNFTADGQFITKWGWKGSTNGRFRDPKGIAIGPAGLVYVADTFNHRIQIFTADGQFVDQWGSWGTLPCPASVALGKEEDNLSLLRIFRDEVLTEDSRGQEYVNLFYRHARELTWLLVKDQELRSRTGQVLRRLLPQIQALLNGKEAILSVAVTQEVELLLDQLETKASPELLDTIEMIKEDLLDQPILEFASVSKPMKQASLRSASRE